jgi:DNA-binding transcriptional regulator YiaG
MRVHRSSISLHFRQVRRYPAAPKTLGDHLRKKRVDMQLSMTQLAKLLEFGITDSAIEKWEKNQNRPTEEHRKLIVEFLGFNPGSKNPTGGF